MQRINIKQLAQKSCASVSSIRKHVAGIRPSPMLEGLPAPVCRGRKLLWLECDVDAWLAAQSSAPTPTPAPAPAEPKRRRGRPRKITTAAAGGEGGAA